MKKILLLTIIFCLKLVSSQEEANFKLPFDFLQYQLQIDRYSHGETDERIWLADISNELEKAYLKKWDNDTVALWYIPFDLNSNKFELYMFVGCLKDDNVPLRVYRLVTLNKQNEVIDGITSSISGPDDGDWKQQSFYISENLEITLYKNKTDQKKVLESKVSGKYRVKENGKFEKIQ